MSFLLLPQKVLSLLTSDFYAGFRTGLKGFMSSSLEMTPTQIHDTRSECHMT